MSRVLAERIYLFGDGKPTQFFCTSYINFFFSLSSQATSSYKRRLLKIDRKQKELRSYIFWVRARSQLGTRYMGQKLKTSCLAENELLEPIMTKNMASEKLVHAFNSFMKKA